MKKYRIVENRIQRIVTTEVTILSVLVDQRSLTPTINIVRVEGQVCPGCGKSWNRMVLDREKLKMVSLAITDEPSVRYVCALCAHKLVENGVPFSYENGEGSKK